MPALIRCPVCDGLRTISQKHKTTTDLVCRECKQGKIIPRWTFCTYWVERFTMDEIDEMADAVWG